MDFSPMSQSASMEVLPIGIARSLDSDFIRIQQKESKSEQMHVYVRVRPMLQREENENYKQCVAVIEEDTVRALVPLSSAKFKNSNHTGEEIFEDFKFTQAFGPEFGQFEFFQNTIMDIMQNFIEGQNCLVFSYGITNSGKTFTLQGNEANPGIIPLAMHLFFACAKHQLLDGISVKSEKFADIVMLDDSQKANELDLKDKLMKLADQSLKASISNSSTKYFAQTLCECFHGDFNLEIETTLAENDMVAAQNALEMKRRSKESMDKQVGLCSIWISFIEIYNEYIYDLLNFKINVHGKGPSLALGADQNGDVYVKGAQEICVSSSEEAIKLLHIGRKNLRMASTKLNYESSRSHCIFTVKVVRVMDEGNGQVNRIAFCDLAGSERATKAQTTLVRLKEAGYINTSLMVLGRCLKQLYMNQSARDKKMIPFRESKLTHLFSNHFLGSGKAVMIANVSPCEYTFDETLNVLHFSAIASKLNLNDSYISMASTSIQNITNQWVKTKSLISDVSQHQSCDFEESFSEDLEERDEIIEKLLELASNLRSNLEKEKKEKAELEIKIRQEVVSEYSQYTDRLLEDQSNNSEKYVESLREYFKKSMDDMEKKYEELKKEYNELREVLEEYENESEEDSFNASISKKRESLKIKLNRSAISSPSVFEKDTKPDIEAINSLKEELEFVTNELKVAKEQMEATSEHLKKLQNVEAEGKIQDLIRKLEEAKQSQEESICKISELENYKNHNLKLSEDLTSLEAKFSDLEKQLRGTEELKQNFSSENETALQLLTTERNRVNDLVLESSTLKAEKEKMVENIGDLEANLVKVNKELETVSSLEQKFSDVQAQLDETSKDLEIQKLKNKDLEVVKIQLAEMAENQTSTELEKQQNVQNVNDFVTKIKELENKCEDCEARLIQNELEKSELELKIQSLEAECVTCKNDYEQLLKDYSSLKEEFNTLKENLGEQSISNKSQLSELEKECRIHKDNYTKVSENYKTLDTAFSKLTEEYAITKAQFEELKCQMVNKTENDEKSSTELEQSLQKQAELSEELSKMKSDLVSCEKQLGEIEVERNALKVSSLSGKQAEVLAEKIKNYEDQIELFNTEKFAHQKEISSLQQEVTHLKERQLQNNHAELLQLLEKSELCAKDKIENLITSSNNMKEEIEDMRRQLNEKETSIEQLEKALFDNQENLKENDAISKEQLNTLKEQHSSDMKELLNQKNIIVAEKMKILETLEELNQNVQKLQKDKEAVQKENLELSAALEKAKCEQNAAELELEKNAKKVSKGGKKRSLSDMSKDAEKETGNKENSDHSPEAKTRTLRKETSKQDVKEKKKTSNTVKRRRVLRSTQEKVVESDDSDSSVEESDSEEEFIPKKKAIRKKKAADKKTEPVAPIQRVTSRRKLPEPEQSPVKKAMNFVSSKFRSVAETVSNLPGPRVTRGRRKLYNADAEASNKEKKWKI